MRHTRAAGVTLVEVLVAIAIVAVLSGLLLPAVQQARAAAATSACKNNLRQIALGATHYDATVGALPSGVNLISPGALYPGLGWLALLLPYVEQAPLWETAVAAYAFQGKSPNPLLPPHVGIQTPLSLYACPADPRQATAHSTNGGYRVAVAGYLGVAGQNLTTADGTLYYNSHIRLRDITDGTSNTLLAGERPPSPDYWYGWWYAAGSIGTVDTIVGVRGLSDNSDPGAANCPAGPYHFVSGQIDNVCDAFHFWSVHIGGAHFALADGSVRFLTYSVDPIMPALASRAGGEVVSLPD